MLAFAVVVVPFTFLSCALPSSAQSKKVGEIVTIKTSDEESVKASYRRGGIRVLEDLPMSPMEEMGLVDGCISIMTTYKMDLRGAKVWVAGALKVAGFRFAAICMTDAKPSEMYAEMKCAMEDKKMLRWNPEERTVLCGPPNLGSS